MGEGDFGYETTGYVLSGLGELLEDCIRSTVSEVASRLVGLGAAQERQAYLDLVAVGEDPARAAEMAKNSGCGLTIRGIWRLCGVDDPRLKAPYRPGAVISDLFAIARAVQAVVYPKQDELPDVGDVVLVGSNTDKTAGGVEHVFTVVDHTDDTVTSVDGGQVDAQGHQIIKRLTRPAKWDRKLWIGSRRVACWVDVTRLTFASTLILPVRLTVAPPTEPVPTTTTTEPCA